MMFTTFCKTDREREKKKLLHSLAPALTLTLSLTHSLDHLVNKLHRMTNYLSPVTRPRPYFIPQPFSSPRLRDKIWEWLGDEATIISLHCEIKYVFGLRTRLWIPAARRSASWGSQHSRWGGDWTSKTQVWMLLLPPAWVACNWFG